MKATEMLGEQRDGDSPAQRKIKLLDGLINLAALIAAEVSRWVAGNNLIVQQGSFRSPNHVLRII